MFFYRLINHASLIYRIKVFFGPSVCFFFPFVGDRLSFKVCVARRVYTANMFFISHGFLGANFNSYRSWLTVVFSLFFSLFFLSFFTLKIRLRFSGLAYYILPIKNNTLELHLGFTTLPLVSVPDHILSISFSKKNKKVLMQGLDPQRLRLFGAHIRSFRPVGVYKRKGVRFRFEFVRVKVVKKKKKK